MKIHHPISYIRRQNIGNVLLMHKMGLGIFSLAYIIRSDVFIIYIT